MPFIALLLQFVSQWHGNCGTITAVISRIETFDLTWLFAADYRFAISHFDLIVVARIFINNFASSLVITSIFCPACLDPLSERPILAVRWDRRTVHDAMVTPTVKTDCFPASFRLPELSSRTEPAFGAGLVVSAVAAIVVVAVAAVAAFAT